MQDIKVPMRVHRRVSAPNKKSPAPAGTTALLHHETSRFVVDLRASMPQKTFAADIVHKSPHPWKVDLELGPEVRSQKSEVTHRSTTRKKPVQTKSQLPAPSSQKSKHFRLRVSGFRKGQRRLTFGFMLSILAVALIVPALGQVGSVQTALINYGLKAANSLANAGAALTGGFTDSAATGIGPDAALANQEFTAAYSNFLDAQAEVKRLGQTTLSVLSNLPGLNNQVNTGTALLDFGTHVAQFGQAFSAALLEFEGVDFGNILAGEASLTERLLKSQNQLSAAALAAVSITEDLKRIDVEVLPEAVASEVAAVKTRLPSLQQAALDAQKFIGVLNTFLGNDNPRKYIIIFQNNAEIRPTGGFIGSYGRLDFYKGKVDQFYIDDVYNIDGQLKENVVPPKPMQKITGAWSFHDANWYFDFPSSAQNLNYFYEATGHASLDGVVAMTPSLLEKILTLTGPIEVPEHDATFTAANVIDILQYKVERDFDKEINQPKTVVADLAAHIIEKLKTANAQTWGQLASAFLKSLSEKDVQFWFRDPALEQFVADQGWSGEVLDTTRDYLAVVNTNLNGYKTDRVIAQAVDHEVNIDSVGQVIVTTTITRTHTGGGSAYDWYNRVNSNYLRVYVPLGSELLSAQGQTREKYQAPLDYDALGFRRANQVVATERALKIDEATGTQIFTEAGKTVFGNWVYVSPGQTATVVYRYRLPFTLDPAKGATYSMLVQKQPGMKPSRFRSVVTLPSAWRTTWQTDNLRERVDGWRFDTELVKDEFYGMALSL